MKKFERKLKVKCSHCGTEFKVSPIDNPLGTYIFRDENDLSADGDCYEVFISVTEPNAYGVYSGEGHEYEAIFSKPVGDDDIKSLIFQICEIERIYTGKVYFELSVTHVDDCIDCEEGEVEVDMKLTNELSKFIDWDECCSEFPRVYEIDRLNSTVIRIE